MVANGHLRRARRTHREDLAVIAEPACWIENEPNRHRLGNTLALGSAQLELRLLGPEQRLRSTLGEVSRAGELA